MGDALSIRETEEAIKTIKDTFEHHLSTRLNLRRISAPLFLDKDSALNDYLNGTEVPLSFTHDHHRVESSSPWPNGNATPSTIMISKTARASTLT